MDLFENIALGCSVAFSLANIFYCFAGVLLGTLVGVLPGIGPSGTIAILFPVTFGMNPVSAIIMLAGIYYGGQYGGSTTSILVNIPGEASSLMTCIDGHQMALQGRAGPALGIAAFGSFIAGTLTLFPIAFLAGPLSSVALSFGPPEYFGIVVMGLCLLISLSRGSIFKGVIMAIVGVCLSQIGMDMIAGKQRFTFGIPELQSGIGLTPLIMGVYGISEVLSNLGGASNEVVDILQTKIKGLLPSWKDWKQSILPIIRATALGFPMGVIPGIGPILATFTSYSLEKRVSRHPETFGTGTIEGVAGPEAANNAAAQGHFIPLFILGIPSNASMGLLLGALMVHNVTPGPFLIAQHPDIFWGTIVSMYIGNALLLVLNLPLIPLWVKVLKIPYRILFPLILLFCIVGVYSVQNSVFDVLVMMIFGVIGFLLRKSKYEMTPLVIAFILAPIAQVAFRQSLIISQGSPLIFISRPVPLIALGVAAIVLLAPLLPTIGKRREALVTMK